jgi:hypothetical protein
MEKKFSKNDLGMLVFISIIVVFIIAGFVL